MTLDERQKIITKIFENELLPILTKKGHDYSGDDDSLSNLRDFGLAGIIVRIGDKYHRLKNYCKSGQLLVKDESVEDTLRDLVNYGLIALAMQQESAGFK